MNHLRISNALRATAVDLRIDLNRKCPWRDPEVDLLLGMDQSRTRMYIHIGLQIEKCIEQKMQ